MVTELSTADFAKYISNKDLTIVDFWAPWCGPCKMMAPIFEDVSAHFDDVQFAKVNVDEHGELAGEYQVQGIPTMIFFKDGKEVHRVTGFIPKDKFVDEIQDNL